MKENNILEVHQVEIETEFDTWIDKELALIEAEYEELLVQGQWRDQGSIKNIATLKTAMEESVRQIRAQDGPSIEAKESSIKSVIAEYGRKRDALMEQVK
jgi:hypothetical protein